MNKVGQIGQNSVTQLSHACGTKINLSETKKCEVFEI